MPIGPTSVPSLKGIRWCDVEICKIGDLRLIRAVGDCRGVQGVQKVISDNADNADTAEAPRRLRSAKNSSQKRPDKQGWPKTDPIRTEAPESNSV